MADKRKPPIRQRPIHIYEADIEEIKKNQEEIYEGIKKILLSLSHLK